MLTKQDSVCELYGIGGIQFVFRHRVNERNGSSPQLVGGTIVERVVCPILGQKRPKENHSYE